VSSGVLIIFYAITKINLVTAASWREHIKKNQKLLKYCKNEKRLPVNKMSIELTHLILMSKGPEADEFTRAADMKLPNKFGNLFTKAECSLMNIYFFI